MKITRSTIFQPIHFSLLLACGIATGAHAQALVTDQSLQPPPLTGGSYHYDSALANLLPGTGQEFTPSLPGLDFVDVNLHNSSAAATGMFEIAIHAGNIAAPVLELSDPVFRSE